MAASPRKLPKELEKQQASYPFDMKPKPHHIPVSGLKNVCELQPMPAGSLVETILLDQSNASENGPNSPVESTKLIGGSPEKQQVSFLVIAVKPKQLLMHLASYH